MDSFRVYYIRMHWKSPGLFARLAAITLLLAQLSCSSIGRSAGNPPDGLKPGFAAITADDLLKHIKILSSDTFEGRAPGTRGETLTVEYLDNS
jgi:hypothetical protein